MKLLIIVNWYPPDLRVPARRWGNLVSHLQKQGVTCTVVSAGDGFFSESVGKAGEKVIRLPISNLDSQADASAMGAWFRQKRRTLQKFAFATVPPILREFNARKWLLQPRTYPELMRLADESDYIASSYGPFGPFALGWWLAKRARKSWIADIRDSIDFKDGLVLTPARSMSRTLERYLLRKAKLRITIGVMLAEYLGKLYRLQFHEIYNGWEDSDLIQKQVASNTQQPYLYYAGSVYSHRLPALDLVCQAIKDTPGIKLRIRLLKDHTRGELMRLIDMHATSGQVELLEPVEQSVVDTELADAYAALVLEDIASENEVMNSIVTGKLLGLLASGIPGIAVSGARGEIRSFVGKVANWYGVNTVSDFQRALAALIARSSEEMPTESLHVYHMSEQACNLLRLMRGIN